MDIPFNLELYKKVWMKRNRTFITSSINIENLPVITKKDIIK